jgi:hypothetical protein
MTCVFCKHAEYATFYNDVGTLEAELLICEIKKDRVDYEDSCKDFEKEGEK